jgi:hypothetical protein
VNSFLHRLNKFGTLTTVLAHIAFLGAVPFQALYPSVSISPTERQTITAKTSQLPNSPNYPPNTKSRQANAINVAAADVHLDGSNDLTVTDAIQTNAVDTDETGGHIVNWRPGSDEHLAQGTSVSTFSYTGAGDQAFFWAATTAEAVPALFPTASATGASSTAVQPSPEKPGQTTFTDIPGGIIAASTIILTLVIVLVRRRRSAAAEG